MLPDVVDVAVVGGGAAGLAAAIFTRRRVSDCRVVLLDGASRLGAKILISGGGRCNLTNRDVTASDYNGGPRAVIASVLRSFPVPQTVAFFEELGVRLHEEERGKLFPDTNRARSVLDALLSECARLGVEVRAGQRVESVRRGAGHAAWQVSIAGGAPLSARCVVLATGGLSVPKTGSDGGGLAIAAALGHTIVPTTPALVPLVLEGRFHQPLSGVSHEGALAIEADGRTVARLRGPILWTHFGASGPLALDASRHWLRAVHDGRRPAARLSFVPGGDFAAVERALLPAAHASSRSVRSAVGQWLPAAVADAIVVVLGLDPALRLPHLPRDARRRLAHALTGWELPIGGSRGYNYAEATAGGVSLDEVNRHTLESARCPGLHFVGEMLDVDGRLGGFNFQWAWSSAWVAAQAVGRALAKPLCRS